MHHTFFAQLIHSLKTINLWKCLFLWVNRQLCLGALQIRLKRKGIHPLLSDSMDLRILSFLSEWGGAGRPISIGEASEFYSKSFEFSSNTDSLAISFKPPVTPGADSSGVAIAFIVSLLTIRVADVEVPQYRRYSKGQGLLRKEGPRYFVAKLSIVAIYALYEWPP